LEITESVSKNDHTLYGLIGYPLGHSFSAMFFKEKFARLGLINHDYRLFELQDISAIRNFTVQYKSLRGFNVTIPHKQSILDYLDVISPDAMNIGAVNCVKIKDGIWTGYNTDALGFQIALSMFLQENCITNPKQAIILGNGGSSKAVQWVLNQENIPFVVASRRNTSDTIHYDEITPEFFEKIGIIINTTPLGMYPATGTAPELPYHALNNKHLLIDLVYNPEKTLFLTRGSAMGCKIMNGKKMLEEQAEASWNIWNT